MLAGCVGLPGPDGFEAAIIKRSQALPVLAPATGHDVKSVARNGLLLELCVALGPQRFSRLRQGFVHLLQLGMCLGALRLPLGVQCSGMGLQGLRPRCEAGFVLCCPAGL